MIVTVGLVLCYFLFGGSSDSTTTSGRPSFVQKAKARVSRQRYVSLRVLACLRTLYFWLINLHVFLSRCGVTSRCIRSEPTSKPVKAT